MTRSSTLTRVATAVIALVASVSLATPARAAAPFDWTDARITLPWKAAPLSDGAVCPGGRVTFTGLGEATPTVGSATRGEYVYYLQVVASADVTGDGRPDVVLRLACNHQQLDDQFGWYYLYTVRNGRPVLLDFITASDEQANAEYAVLGAEPATGRVVVTEFVRGRPDLVVRTFSWVCRHLVVDQPLPLHPEADIAP